MACALLVAPASRSVQIQSLGGGLARAFWRPRRHETWGMARLIPGPFAPCLPELKFKGIKHLGAADELPPVAARERAIEPRAKLADYTVKVRKDQRLGS